MKSRVFWAVGSGLLFAALSGCGGDSSSKVPSPGRLTLYSIDGTDGPKATPGGETFHGYPVLGKVALDDPLRRQGLMDAFDDGVAKGGDMAKCFWPRHGLRVEKDGAAVDHAICFECQQFATYRGDQAPAKNTAIARSPLARFDDELKRAGVPLAPSPFKRGE